MLASRVRYLQIALNSTLSDAQNIITSLPPSPRILIEAGTPLIKHYGTDAIVRLKYWHRMHNLRFGVNSETFVVADLKCMDRAETEVSIAANSGADAAVVLGHAPIQTIIQFIKSCQQLGIDSMVDMMNVREPYKILRQLYNTLPSVVILHRGVDETELGDTPLPIHMINKIKSTYNVKISIAGGDTLREVQSAIFNGADIVVVWKNFYTYADTTGHLAEEFLRTVK